MQAKVAAARDGTYKGKKIEFYRAHMFEHKEKAVQLLTRIENSFENTTHEGNAMYTFIQF
jgi:hypothetical protein